MDQAKKLKNIIRKCSVEEILAQLPAVDLTTFDGEINYGVLCQSLVRCSFLFVQEKDDASLLKILSILGHPESPLPFTDEEPQCVELYGNAVAALAILMDKVPEHDKHFHDIMGKIPKKTKYAQSDGSLNYNLACYFAKQGDRASAIEYVRRARFYYTDNDKFLDDDDLAPLADDAEFKDALANTGYLYARWWHRVWPLEERYDPAKHSGEM